MPAHISLIGRRFGRLLVSERIEKNGQEVKFKWLCQCDCGAERAILGDSLTSGKTSSCGCLNREIMLKHDMSRTSYYRAWQSMIARCEKPSNSNYHLYGGRGIAVCDRWKDFPSFYKDMGDRPGPNYSLERENNNGNYEPGNCRWATDTEQQRHKRRQRNNTGGVTGVYWNSGRNRWDANIKVNGENVHIGGFDSVPAAAAARKEAERFYGFHPSHGEE